MTHPRHPPAPTPRNAPSLQASNLLRSRQEISITFACPGYAPKENGTGVGIGESGEVVAEEVDEGAIGLAAPPRFQLILVDPDLRNKLANGGFGRLRGAAG